MFYFRLYFVVTNLGWAPDYSEVGITPHFGIVEQGNKK